MANAKPCVGVPYRTSQEEAAGRKPEKYLRMVEQAGGEGVLVALGTPRSKLEGLAQTLDAFVLPGSPADIDPKWFHAERHARTADPDSKREETDFTLLDVAFSERKPLLAICYGCQSLSVHRGGTLIQHIPEAIEASLKHNWRSKAGEPEPFHAVTIEPGSRLAQLSGATEAQVNSSHHQAVDRPGRDLRIVARATDGVVEALELTDGSASPAAGAAHWVTAVQWHPERMDADPLAQALFRELVAAARRVVV